MTTDLEFAEPIRRIFTEKLFVEISTDHEDLIEAGILDSMLLVDLLANLEREFGITLNELSRKYETGIVREKEHLKQELQTVYSSTSWRITRPLRRFSDFLKSLVRRGR